MRPESERLLKQADRDLDTFLTEKRQELGIVRVALAEGITL